MTDVMRFGKTDLTGGHSGKADENQNKAFSHQAAELLRTTVPDFVNLKLASLRLGWRLSDLKKDFPP